MRTTLGLTLALLLVCVASPAAATSDPTEALFSDTIQVIGDPVHLVPIPPGKAFEVKFKVGALQIAAKDTFEARLEIYAACKEVSPEYCAKRVARLRLETDELDDRVRVQLAGMSRREMKKLGVEATIVVPERSPLIVDMGIGALEIDAGPQDLQVGMSIGDLVVHAPSEGIGSVGISTRIGEAALETLEDPYISKRMMLLGAKVKWDEGEGDSRIAVKLGIGNAEVHLD